MSDDDVLMKSRLRACASRDVWMACRVTDDLKAVAAPRKHVQAVAIDRLILLCLFVTSLFPLLGVSCDRIFYFCLFCMLPVSHRGHSKQGVFCLLATSLLRVACGACNSFCSVAVLIFHESLDDNLTNHNNKQSPNTTTACCTQSTQVVRI